MTKLVLIRSTSPIFEPVLHKRARVAREAGLDTTVLYWDRFAKDTQLRLDDVPYVPLNVGVSSYGAGLMGIGKRAAFTLKALGKLKELKPEVIHAFDFDMMLVAAAYRYLFNRKVRLVYDILDFIHGFSSPIPDFVRNLVKSADASLMAAADAILLPDENRVDQIPEKYRNKVSFLYNAPELPENLDTVASEATYLSNKNRIQILYIGGLSADRGLVPLMEACARHPSRFQLTLGGQGVLQPDVENYACKYGNIEYLGQVPFHKVLELTRASDLLYAVYDPACPVNKVASPNKFFEAIAFSKPIVVARDTSIDKKVQNIGMGYIVSYENGEALSSVESTLLAVTREDLEEKGRNAGNVKSIYSWAAVKSALRQIYLTAAKA